MFTHEKLAFLLKQYPVSACFWIAYSGGLDSHVLLYALSQLLPTERLRAIHINHGLHIHSDKWAKICRHACEKLTIDCEIVTLDIRPKTGESLEASLREARYHAIEKKIPAGNFLLTAHHRNDQAETFLLQLFRGAGLKGLISMPFCRPLTNNVYLMRPLLNFTRQELYAYAQTHHLTWIEDDSNKNQRFSRNFIRHQVLPRIQQRWPQAHKTIARSAANLAEAHALLDEIAEQDWNNIQGPEWHSIMISRWMTLSAKRQINVLRYGLKRHGSLPSQKQLKQIDILLKRRVNTTFQVSWGNVQLRRYRDYLYFFNSLENKNRFIFKKFIPWCLNQTLILPTFDQLVTKQAKGIGLNAALLTDKYVEVTFRQGGERFYPNHGQNSRSLKKLFQEWGVPPWQRNRIPLIYYQKELIAVVDYAINPRFSAHQNELGIVIEWVRKSPLHQRLFNDNKPTSAAR
ncbi:tRNA(Ile)-lysidine synthase (tRNA(Ile)-lysidinesynthetase) (tRNA(Ile)-2-lysyl-cytidine synthase) [Rickettsiella grylli]|uniref:tRNA(Ile)-lysidine synthase n=2 Tax=Rickettsiella grylli TaxID=59196 RepID=A8PPS8_9COXI|nr:tRNA(Ile)-lysidine synthase (tRNA(Ile)-lysidinesynthetase) (tRNA(Ile)-2-lysyl-cytidine synthase) [Rickettsiella grylli]